MENHELLRGHALFKDFSDDELKVLTRALNSKKVAPGENIIYEGEKGLSLFILGAGTVEVLKKTQSGEKPTISTILPGSVFGEMALIDEHIRTAGVVAGENVVLWELNYDTLAQISDEEPRVGAKMYRIIAKSLSDKIKATTEDLLGVIQSARMAAVGEMAGSIAHEINNPMFLIQLHGGKIQKEIKNPTPDLTVVQKSTDKILDMVVRVDQIIKSVKALSREASQDPFEPASVKEIVEQTFEICRARMRDNNIKLESKLPDPDILWRCRSVQISQVVLNMINNAVDAIQSMETPWIEVAAKMAGESLEISITDSGPGIPPAVRDKIFKSFYTTKAVGKGTGLGLSIAVKIIESHKGTIEIDPNCKNTRFVVRLPKLS